jgi:hypothetical protein
LNSILVRIATTTAAALTLVLGAASPAQAAGLANCNDPGATTPCFEKVWSDGAQVKMTFVDLSPAPSNASTEKFYVLAPQTRAPQGWVPSCTITSSATSHRGAMVTTVATTAFATMATSSSAVLRASPAVAACPR